MTRLVLCLLLLLGPVLAQESSTNLDSSLQGIASGDSGERLAAERWLAAHIQPGDLERLMQALGGADMEVSRRLARAIGQADRDLRLSTGLLAAKDPALRSAGRRALELSITAWNEHAWRQGIVGQALSLRLRLWSADSWPQILRLPVLPSLGETCGLLGRLGRLPLGIAVSPDVAQRSPVEGVSELVGTWDELVLQLGEIYRVALGGHGFAPDPEKMKGQRFLRFCAATQLAQPSTDVMIEWCAMVAGEGALPMRVAAARALAASGWDAALDWLSIRVATGADQAALEGLLAAAAEGRVARAFGSEELLRSMLRTAEADLEAGDTQGRARRILAAASSLRSRGPGGVGRTQVMLEDWEHATPSGRWLRLALLGKMRSPGGCAQASAILGQADQPAVLYRQALRTWVAGSAGVAGLQLPELAAPGLLFGAHVSLAEAMDTVRTLSLAGFAPPSAWGEPSGLPSSFGPLDRAAVFGWFVMAGVEQAAANHWQHMLGVDPLLWRERGLAFSEVVDEIGLAQLGNLRRAWGRARRSLDSQPALRLALDRSAFLAGLLERSEQVRIWNELAAGFAEDGLDLMAMATLAGRMGKSSVGGKVLAGLLDQLRQALQENRTVEDSEELIAALVRSVGEMEKTGWELSNQESEQGRRNGAEQWSESVRRLAERSKRSPLGTYFTLHWPPALESGMRDLEAEARIPLAELRVDKDTPTEGAAFRR